MNARKSTYRHHTMPCPECGGTMRVGASRYGLTYLCDNRPDCTCIHTAHADGSPKGVPANKATRKARVDAHSWFDRLWEWGKVVPGHRPFNRYMAYVWLSQKLGIQRKKCHIGRFDLATCERVIELVKVKIDEYRRAAGAKEKVPA